LFETNPVTLLERIAHARNGVLAALLETDWTRMLEVVQAAESEIHKRRLELSKDHIGTQEEREAVVKALSGLRILRMDAAAWGERQNLK
jgi:hypothetical protein